MCSGCSGDYYSDSTGQEQLSEDLREEVIGGVAADEGDLTLFHYGNSAAKSLGASDVRMIRGGQRCPGPGTHEEYEIFVSERQITEIRVLRAAGSVRGYSENVIGACEQTEQVREHSEAATAKRYRTLVGATLLLLSDLRWFAIRFVPSGLAALVTALIGIWAATR